MTTPLLALEDVTAGYDSVPVVRDLNLHVDPGEVVAHQFDGRKRLACDHFPELPRRGPCQFVHF